MLSVNFCRVSHYFCYPDLDPHHSYLIFMYMYFYMEHSDSYYLQFVIFEPKLICCRLNRAFDYETKEMLELKNKAKAIIIVYDNDESIANK